MSTRTHLTTTKIKAIKPTGKDYIAWDDSPVGSGVRITKKGKLTYIINYRHRNRQRRYAIGDASHWTLEEARAEARKLFVQIDQGIDPQAERVFQQNMGTVEEIVENWREGYLVKNVKPQSLRNHDSMVKKYFGTSNILPTKYRLHKMHLMDVKKLHLIETHNYVTDELGYPSVADRMIKGVLQAWKWSIDDAGLDIPPPPCIKFGNLNGSERRDTVLDATEFKELYEAIMLTHKYSRLSFSTAYVLVWLMFTGCRKSEALRLKFEDIDLEHGVIHTSDKILSSKRIFLGKTMMELIDRIRTAHAKEKIKSPWLFPSPDDPCKPLTQLNSQFEDVCKRIEITHLTPHDLRRSFITAGRNDIDWSEDLISTAIQHQKKTTTQQFYSGNRQDRERAIYNTIVDQIAEMTGFWKNPF